MHIMSQQSKPVKSSNEYENSSHIKNKKKAIATTFQKKNHRDIVELINDEDDEVGERYAKYIRWIGCILALVR